MEFLSMKKAAGESASYVKGKSDRSKLNVIYITGSCKCIGKWI